MRIIGQVKITFCFTLGGLCFLSSKQFEHTNFFAGIPSTITFSRQVVQRTHEEDGSKTITYYFNLNGDYAAMKPDPKSKMGMDLMVYSKGSKVLMFNYKQKTITIVKISRLIGDGINMSNEVAEEIAYKMLTNDNHNTKVIGTGKTKNICGYRAVEYEMKNENEKALWYFIKVDFNPIKIYTMGMGNSKTQANLDSKEIRKLKNTPMGIPVLNKNYLLAEMTSPGGIKDMETKMISKKIFNLSTKGYKIIDLSNKGLMGMVGRN
ncbi:MAG: hypothetical protein WC623_11490 [Pedobacter sp.]|uniref:hypothetical protein n=1 Tax=Pedobacter sp. TaxID=1411316 RepID=UPI003563ECE6